MNAVAPASALPDSWMVAKLGLTRWLVVPVLLALLPLLLVGFSIRLHDGRIHQIWSNQVTGAIVVGGGYPRWLLGMNGGLGSPAMFFYPVLPYLAVAPVLPVFGAAHGLAFGAVVSAVIGGLAMWRLLLRFAQLATALAGAVLYVTAPYYLGTDLYMRGAYAEYWAFAWLPVVLLGVVKLRGSVGGQAPSESGIALAGAAGLFPLTSALSLGEKEVGVAARSAVQDPNGDLLVAGASAARSGATGMSPFHFLGSMLLLAFGYGALVATHLPTTLVFSLVPLALAVVPVGGTRWWDWSWLRWRPFALTVPGMVFGICLAAPYLLPAMTMQEHVSMAALTSFHKYNDNFFFGEVSLGLLDLGHEFKQTLYLPFLAMAVMGLTGFLLARGMSRGVDRSRLTLGSTVQQGVRGELRRMNWFFLAVLNVSVIMMLPLSDFVWRLIPKLQVIQFPWRICSVLTVATVILVALGLDAVRGPLTRRLALQLCFLVGAFGVGLAYTGQAIWKFVETAPPVERVQSFVVSHNMDVPEYRPRWARQDLRTTVQSVRQTPANVERERGTTNGVAWVDLALRPKEPLIGAQTIAGRADLAVLQWQSRRLRLACANEQPATLHVSQLYFPGWTARRTGQVLPLRPSEPAGLLEVDVPAGEGEIILTLEPMWSERTGNRVGLASAGVWLAGGGWMLGRRKFIAKESPIGESA